MEFSKSEIEVLESKGFKSDGSYANIEVNSSASIEKVKDGYWVSDWEDFGGVVADFADAVENVLRFANDSGWS